MLYPEYTTEYISELMSLRPPQEGSLLILEKIMNITEFSKAMHKTELLESIKAMFPICRDFERDFPSVCFALATGVGKTRLMGAFVAYLYTNIGIKNFMVIAPNLTIYNKLIDDFSNPANMKYLFSGIDIFLQNPPQIITGETYRQQVAGQTSFNESVIINIFNIGKINAEVRGNSVPLIKRLSEYIGQSYFDYLSSCDDLTLLMDESHHYRADRGLAVINELNPLLGLELTATPQIESSSGAIKFKNVVYEYSLAKAIADGFVKEPAAATRSDFDPRNYNPNEIDKIKLRDGIRLHRNTKAELTQYAINEGERIVKPFVLVVCKDTDHAAEIRDYIISEDFFDSYYSGKTIIIHSNQRGSEKDENVAQLISLENDDNIIEIVIHVNMLKEGWDVTNLYTIIPLRTASSTTLIEQTVGRGLRLPYGKRTGNAAVDRLIVVAHDKFDKLIEEANKETSIIRQENIINLEDFDDLDKDKEAFVVLPIYQQAIAEKEKQLRYVRSDEHMQELQQDIATTNAVAKAIDDVMTGKITVATDTSSITANNVTVSDLVKPEVQAIVLKKAKKQLQVSSQLSLFDWSEAAIEKTIEKTLSPLIEQRIKGTIDIPDIALIPNGELTYGFHDFDLLTTFMQYSPINEELFIQTLKDNKVSTLEFDDTTKAESSMEEILLSELINYNNVDYMTCKDLLFKLIGQALTHFKSYLKDEDKLLNVIVNHKKSIAKDIYTQMMEPVHFYMDEPSFDVHIIKSTTPILPHGYTRYREDEVMSFNESIPACELKNKVFGGYTKTCHSEYKFDSIPEQMLGVVLERENNGVIKWLRPASRQFKINWQGGKLYEPDFIVETSYTIYILEVKAARDVYDDEVKFKKQAAKLYCENVNKAFAEQGKKKWVYAIILAENISHNSSLNGLLSKALREDYNA